jgi:hypothetical protein
VVKGVEVVVLVAVEEEEVEAIFSPFQTRIKRNTVSVTLTYFLRILLSFNKPNRICLHFKKMMQMMRILLLYFLLTWITSACGRSVDIILVLEFFDI